MTHTFYMQEALALANQARYIAPPNPWVGCLIVKNNKIVGKGHTLPVGQSHAEICALTEAKERAIGSTMYVTLEPCSHYGHTPPCVNAIIESGVSEIFIAQTDPDERVQGNGILRLRDAGIKIHIGICGEEASKNLAPYLHQRRTGLPYTVLKAAISIDGRLAAEDGSSQWITSSEARENAQLIRAESQAIIIGTQTALRDRPRLNVRRSDIPLAKQPLRVVLDSRGTVPVEGPLFDQNLGPTLVMTTVRSSSEKIKEWEDRGIESVVIPSSEEGVDLREAWKNLGGRGILQALVEGGSLLQTQLLKQGLINHLTVYLGPVLLGSSGLPLFRESIGSLAEAPRFKREGVQALGDTIRIDYSI
jgi:diaminohydroxyphosphoribosylaminopyrimidine deaminase/5-amino-6-(5-phosphoribosylamino)uracil reductase